MKISTYYYEKACQSEEEFRLALKVARENQVEEIIKIAEGMKLTKEDYQSSDFVNYPSFCGHMNGHNQTLTDLIEAIKK
jgi:hypothetical protein